MRGPSLEESGWEENPRFKTVYRKLIEDLYPDDVRLHKILLYDMGDSYKRVPFLIQAEIEMRKLKLLEKDL